MTLLEAQTLRKHYQVGDQELEVLRDVNLRVEKGEFLSIMGPSGSGKSTLMHLLGLLDRPTAGDVQVEGRSVGKLSDKELARLRLERMGFVFQAFHLLPRATARANVELPLRLAGVGRSERKARAEELLRQVGLGDRMDNRPDQLSGGQKQRVAIARALAMDPPIILADEPTGNLDGTTTEQIMKLFEDLNRQGRTIIQVTHDADMAKRGTRIVHVRDGRIVRQQRRRV